MMSKAPKVVVVLPTYNECENIGQIVTALFDLALPNFHVLVVDDNSPDGTGQLADDLAARSQYRGRLSVLHRPAKQGLGPAYIHGFKHALALGADLIIQMDADLSHQPKYIPQMLDRIRDYEVVIGSRYLSGGSVDDSWGFTRKLLSWWANRIYTPSILRIPITDATGGFRVFRRECLIGINLDRIKASGYVFQVEMIFVAQRLGYNISEVPIHFPDRQHGRSKMSTAVAAEAALRVWQILVRHRSLKPEDRRQAPYTGEI